MSRAELRVWKVALVLAPWPLFAWLGHLIGDANITAYSPVILILYLSYVSAVVHERRLAWHCAYVAKLPVVQLQLLANRLWRKAYQIEPAPVRLSDCQIWVSAGVRPAQRALLPNVSAAFAVLAAVQPSRASRLARIDPDIVVGYVPATAAYMPGANVLLIDVTLLDESPGVIAGILVHESNHALMASRGVLHPMLVRRLERLANIDAFVFAKRLHESGDEGSARRVLGYMKANRSADYGLMTGWTRMRETIRREDEARANQMRS